MANYYKTSGNRMNAPDSWHFYGFMDNNYETDLSSKGSHKCLHLQLVSKGCKGSHLWVNMVTCTNSVDCGGDFPHE